MGKRAVVPFDHELHSSVLDKILDRPVDWTKPTEATQMMSLSYNAQPFERVYESLVDLFIDKQFTTVQTHLCDEDLRGIAEANSHFQKLIGNSFSLRETTVPLTINRVVEVSGVEISTRSKKNSKKTYVTLTNLPTIKKGERFSRNTGVTIVQSGRETDPDYVLRFVVVDQQSLPVVPLEYVRDADDTGFLVLSFLATNDLVGVDKIVFELQALGVDSRRRKEYFATPSVKMSSKNDNGDVEWVEQSQMTLLRRKDADNATTRATVNIKALFHVNEGRLTETGDGFRFSIHNYKVKDTQKMNPNNRYVLDVSLPANVYFSPRRREFDAVDYATVPGVLLMRKNVVKASLPGLFGRSPSDENTHCWTFLNGTQYQVSATIVHDVRGKMVCAGRFFNGFFKKPFGVAYDSLYKHANRLYKGFDKLKKYIRMAASSPDPKTAFLRIDYRGIDSEELASETNEKRLYDIGNRIPLTRALYDSMKEIKTIVTEEALLMKKDGDDGSDNDEAGSNVEESETEKDGDDGGSDNDGAGDNVGESGTQQASLEVEENGDDGDMGSKKNNDDAEKTEQRVNDVVGPDRCAPKRPAYEDADYDRTELKETDAKRVKEDVE